MAIVKISQLAKEMGLHTDAVVSMLHKLGHPEIKAHNSTIDDSVKKQISEKMKEGAEMAKQRFANLESRSERRKVVAPISSGAASSTAQASAQPKQTGHDGGRARHLGEGGGFRERDRDRGRGRSRDGNRGGGHEGGGQGGHHGGGQSRDPNRGGAGGFGGGNRDGNRSGGQGGYHSGGGQNRDGNRSGAGGFGGGNRDGNRSGAGGFGGGNRDGNRSGGQGGYHSGGGQNRDSNRGGAGGFGGGNRENRENREGRDTRDNPLIDAALAKELADKQAVLQNNEEHGAKKKKGKKHAPKDKFEKKREQEFEMKANVRKMTAQIAAGNVKKKHAKRERNEEIDEEEESNVIHVSEFISVSDFAKMVEEDVPTVIAKCMGLGLFVTINQRIDFTTIQLLAEEFGFQAQLLEEFEEMEEEDEEDVRREALPCPPVVTVMGHVDHGKTSLLDYIRRTSVAQGETGGITQHIAAYSVETKYGAVTFLDTPGHEAFTAMRARGSQITNVVVLVIAADSGVQPQTKEAIDHAKAAGVPIVVAINKIDLPGANPDKIKGELAGYGVLVESYGGKVQSVEISAKKGDGVDSLLELLALETGMLDLKAPFDGPAKGVVIESELDKGKGALATILIQSGTLRKGDVFYTGVHSGKVREMLNEQGQKIKEVLPGRPAIVLGLSGTPQAGDNFKVCKTEKEAREIAAKRRLAEKERSLRNMQNIVSLANLSQKIKDGKMLAINLMVRGDVDGSVEVVAGELQKLSTDEIKVNIILKGVGGIKETDIMLARASGAIIIGFNINPNPKIKASAVDAGVEIKTFRIIYEAIDQVKAAMIGMLAPDVKEEVIGQAEIRELFKVPKIGVVAGCHVLDGKIERNAFARLIRDDVEIADTKVDTLQRFKEQVKEVAAGFECGLTLLKVSDYKIGDRIEVYNEIEIKRKSLVR